VILPISTNSSAFSTWRRAIIVSLSVSPFMLAFQSEAAPEDHTQGFPPLGRIRLTVSEAQIPTLMETLEQFAIDESLKTLRGEFQRNGRTVHQLTLKLDEGTFYFMSNFKNEEHFEMAAYSHASPHTWEPIWQRLINRMVQALGPANVERIGPHT
jgi:hypothetical protein